MPERKMMKEALLLYSLMFSTLCQASSGQTRNPLLLRADSAYEAGKFTESAKLYEAAVRSGAKSTAVYYNTSCSFARAGNKDKALRYLEQAVDGGWRNVERMQKDSDFVNLRLDPRWQATFRKAQASKEKHDHVEALIAHLNILSANAKLYRARPKSAGGGDGSYVDYQIPPKLATTTDGTFSVAMLSPKLLEFTATSALGRGSIVARGDASGRIATSSLIFSGELKKLMEK
jgi:tetratricopeptide (TPR) repeat protein